MKIYTEAMVDIETLDTSASSIVLSIGIVLFNLDGKDTYKTLSAKDRTHYSLLNIDEQVQKGRTSSTGTTVWHLGQEHSHDMSDSKEALTGTLWDISRFVGQLKLWGNGSSFDNAILRDLFQQFDVPFDMFYNDRDLRTLKALSSGVTTNIENKQAHNALADAKYQVLCAQRYYKTLKK